MHLYNSLTNNKDLFIPNNHKAVTLYVCGITPYDTTHLGHAFTYISFDVLVRYLKYQGYDVIYTQNVTDINDRDNDILERAKQKNISWKELAQISTEKFLLDMKKLNWIMPTDYMKASDNIGPVISLIEKLLKNGLAYEVKGNIYFSIGKDLEYGKLSKFNHDKMLETASKFGEGIDDVNKKNPLDFTLWKSEGAIPKKHIPSFDSPFGRGRPGWHIECSAISTSSLGDQIDIHGGGIDLIYPHHEAEIAQSEGALSKKPFVKYWIHTGTIFYEGEKMSKSKGNLVLVSDLLQKYSPNVIRWLLLSHQHGENWEFEEKQIKEAEKIFADINDLISNKKSKNNKENLWKKFNSFMNNNLDTPGVLKLINDSAKKEDVNFAKKALEQLGFLLN